MVDPNDISLGYILIPQFLPEDIRPSGQAQVKEYILKFKSNISTPPGDIPVNLIKQFAEHISIPLCDMNSRLKQGRCPNMYKKSELLLPFPIPSLEDGCAETYFAVLAFKYFQEMAVVNN